MNEFTKGAAYIKEGSSCGDGALLVRDNAPQSHLQVNPKADAELFALTLTTATKLAEAGYDAVKVIANLPMLEQYIGTAEYHKAFDLLVKCRGE